MTLYRLYAQNGDRAGFWVQHRTWANACARVQTIAGQRTGRLPGASPVHDNAEIVVETFDVRSGRRMSGGVAEFPRDRNYSLIAEPWWFHEEALEGTLEPALAPGAGDGHEHGGEVMTDLTADEERYLLDAFDESPREWFRPTSVAHQHFSDRQIDRIVATLVAAGMIDCQPDCHARLTDRGRRQATQLGRPARGNWGRWHGKRRVWVGLLSATAVVVVSLLLSRWSGIL